MKIKPKVYVAGPLTLGNISTNVRNGVYIAELLIKKGIIPFLPHQSVIWDLVESHGLEWWLDYDYQWIMSCDALYRIQGTSVGADREVRFAQWNNIPVFYDIDSLVEYFKNKGMIK